MSSQSPGTMQTDRLAVDWTGVRIDGQSEVDRLNFVHDYAGLLRFWNQFNHPDGDWRALFEDELGFVLADIARVDLAVDENDFQRLKLEFAAAPSVIAQQIPIVQALDLVLKTGDRLQKWYWKICGPVAAGAGPP